MKTFKNNKLVKGIKIKKHFITNYVCSYNSIIYLIVLFTEL